MPDYARDFYEVVKRVSEGSHFKKERLLRKIEKFGEICRKHGVDINATPQARFAELLSKDGHGDFETLMRNLCFARLLRNDYSDWQGWQFRNDWARASYLPDLAPRRWKGEKTSLAILGEQGIGDEIMFASCIPDVLKLTQDVTIECDPRLETVFQRSFGVRTRPRIDVIERKGSTKYLRAERPEEKFIPSGDLPKMFRRSISDFHRQAFLTPDPEMVRKWGHLKGRIGLAWRGRVGQFKPSEFGIEKPVCLQYDAWEYETVGMEVPECDLHNGVEDLMGIAANLSKIVTVTQTIVHIAGSIGTRVEVVIPKPGTSRKENLLPYRYTDPMPWYKDVKVYPSLAAYRG